MHPENPEISAVIPAYNEDQSISACVSSVKTALERAGASFEILVVDDGSSDATWQRVEDEHGRDARVKGIRLSRNFGKEAALTAGLEMAQGLAVIVLDADMQHPPEVIPEMLRLWREDGAAVVEGVKRRRGGEPLIRRLLSRAFSRVAGGIAGFDWNGASDFKLVDRRALEAIRSMEERRRFFRGMTAWIGFPRVQVEFDVDQRAGGKSKWTGVKLLRLAWRAVTSFSSLPLRIIHLTGLLFLVLAVALAVRALQLWFAGTAIGGFTTVVLLLLIIGGMVLLSLAIIAEYIIAIYDEVKKRPHYIVRSKLT